MTFRFEVPARLFAGCSGAVSREESRPILNGINFTGGLDGEVRACATNGHALVMGRSFSEQPTVLPAYGIILPPPKLSALGVTSSALDTARVVATSEDGELWTFTAIVKGKYGSEGPSGKMATARAIEGPFPNVCAVIPARDRVNAVERIALDPDVFNQATALLGKCVLQFDGDSRAIIATPLQSHGVDMFALLMPCSMRDAVTIGAPIWVHEQPAEATA